MSPARPLRRRRMLIVASTVVGVIAIAAVAIGIAASRSGGDDAREPLKVDWGTPGCVYDEASRTVAATLTITGESSAAQDMTVTVTAYADENTSEPVGSGVGSTRVHGIVDAVLHVTVPVGAPPHIGEDDVAACRREVAYSR